MMVVMVDCGNGGKAKYKVFNLVGHVVLAKVNLLGHLINLVGQETTFNETNFLSCWFGCLFCFPTITIY